MTDRASQAPVREVGVPVATVWRSQDSPRDVDEAAVRDVPDVAAWASSMDQELRLGLHGRTETQLLLGEPVAVLEEHDGWCKVAALWQTSPRHPDGYPGWVRTAHLSQPVTAERGMSARVVSRTATCTVEGSSAIELSMGTALWVASLAERHVAVHLPDGRTGRLDVDDVRMSHKRHQPTYGPDDVLVAAAQFLGLRYLWGGTSSWGLDCSGLVHLVMRSFAVALPRDAHDQAHCPEVAPVELDEVEPGDLYFFARPDERVYHVGIVTRPVDEDGVRWMLHAPEGGELIEDAPLAPHRRETLVSAGRVRKPDAGQLPGYEDVEPGD
jgi:cell wall-associated NlpC family hydrolase